MNQPSYHPEHLLDRARGGLLDQQEQFALQQHLTLCSICSAQLDVIPVTSALPNVTAADLYQERLVVEQVLRRLQRDGARRASGYPTARRNGSHRAFLALILVASSGTAVAATWWSLRALVPRASESTAKRLRAESKPGNTIARGMSPSVANNRAPPAFVPEESATGTPPRPAEERISRGRGAHARRPTAAELFSQARELRLAGDEGAARGTYQRLQDTYPRAPESLMSHLILGRLWLSAHRPELAASQFAQYLVVGGDASEEALVGRATAFESMDRSTAEAADWRSLLSRYPHSLYADRARVRLETLQRSSGGNTSRPLLDK